MEKDNVLNRNMFDYSKFSEIMQFILICTGALLVPTFLAQLITLVFGQSSWIASHSQIIVGYIVNVSLITAALNVKGFKKIVRNYHSSKHFCNSWWLCV